MTVGEVGTTGVRRAGPLRAELADLPSAVWVLAAGSFINRFGGFVVPFLVLYLTQRGYSASDAAGAVSAYAVGKIAAGPFGGLLAERVGVRIAMVASMLGSAVATLTLAAVTGLVPILVVAAITGLTSEAYRPSVSVIMTAVPAPSRAMAFSVYQLGVSVGTTVGPAIGGLVAERGFLVLFLADAATSALWALLAWRALPDMGARTTRPRVRRGQSVLTDRPFLRLLAVTVLVNMILFQGQTTLPIWVHGHGLSSGTYGFLLALNSGLVMALQIPSTRFVQRWKTTSVIAFTSVLTGAGFAMIAVAHSIVVLVAAVTVWSLGELVQWPVAADHTLQLAPPGLSGRYAGARSFCYGVALLVAPLAGTALYQLHPTILWMSCGVAGIVAAVIIRPRPDDKQ